MQNKHGRTLYGLLAFCPTSHIAGAYTCASLGIVKPLIMDTPRNGQSASQTIVAYIQYIPTSEVVTTF